MAEKSKVYFADFRAPSWRENLPQKLARLMMTAGFGDIDMDGKYVAIKMHFGEPGNLAYLRPNWAKAVADLVKSHGGKPFLTDCNTLYVGGRKNALDHIESAYVNGFTPYSTGCHILIADGLKGNDEVEVPVEGGEYVKDAKIGRAVMDADVFISLTHFKGHEQAGMGGALKNIGMGCGSRAGKMEQHNSGKPFVKQKKCVGCRACARICAHGAPHVRRRRQGHHRHGQVRGLRPLSRRLPQGRHPAACTTRRPAILNKKIAEYTKAVVDGRPCFHVSLVRGRLPQLRLPRGERCAHRPGRGHVRLLRPGGPGPGLCRRRAAPRLPSARTPPCLTSGCDCDCSSPTTSTPPIRTPTGAVCLEHAEKIGIGTRDIRAHQNLIGTKRSRTQKVLLRFRIAGPHSGEQGVELLHHRVRAGVRHQHHKVAIGDNPGLVPPHLRGRGVPGAAGACAVPHLIVDSGLEDVLHRLDIAAVLPPLPGQSRHRRRRSWPSAPDTAGWRWRRVRHRTCPASHPPRPSGRATSPGPRSRKRRNPPEIHARKSDPPLEGQRPPGWAGVCRLLVRLLGLCGSSTGLVYRLLRRDLPDGRPRLRLLRRVRRAGAQIRLVRPGACSDIIDGRRRCPPGHRDAVLRHRFPKSLPRRGGAVSSIRLVLGRVRPGSPPCLPQAPSASVSARASNPASPLFFMSLS